MRGEPTLVLMPGMDGTGELFAGLLAALPDGLTTRVIRYPTDRPLDGDALTEFVEDSSPNRSFVLFAESFSGPVAVRYASRRPRGLRAVILCATFVTSPVSPVLAQLGAAASGVLPTVPPAMAVRAMMLDQEAPPALISAIQEAMAQVEPPVFQGRLRAIAGVDVRRELAQVDVPVFYLRALHDRLVGASALRQIRSIVPSLTVFEIDSGHLVAQSRPHEVARVILEVLEGLDGE